MEQTVPKMLKDSAGKWPEIPAQYFKNAAGTFSFFTYKELLEKVLDFGAGLLSLGIKREENVGLISDNRYEWLQSSLGIMAIGAADVPRGCDATEQEITHILSFSECKFAVLENEAQIRKVLTHLAEIPLLESIISIDNVDFNEVDKARSEFTEIIQKYIRQREYITKNVDCFNPKSFLSSIALEQYNDINFSNFVLNELCEAFNDELRLVSSTSKNVDISPSGQVICICIFRNFGDFFQKWIIHYKNIGITKFVLINCGKIEEFDELKKYINSLNVDVDFWRWSGVFSCNKECAIKQRIIDFYGINKWYLLVDSDELFIFPGFLKKNIRDYIVELEQKQVLLTKSLMIDIYPKGNVLLKKDLDEWKYIDKSGYCRESKRNKIPRFYGGMRTRVFGIKSSIQKMSLFKYTGNEFIANDHFIYPYELNNVPLKHVLLHYKFQPGFLDYYKTLIDEKVHWNESSEYKKYLNIFDKNKEVDLYDDCISTEIDYDTIFELLK